MWDPDGSERSEPREPEGDASEPRPGLPVPSDAPYGAGRPVPPAPRGGWSADPYRPTWSGLDTPPPGPPPGTPPPSGGWPYGPPPSSPPSESPRRRRTRRSLVLATVVAALVALGVATYDGTRVDNPNSNAPAALTDRRSQSAGDLDVDAIAKQVTPGIVDITTTLGSNGQAAGTGMVISSSGLVLTNNHVIADSTSIEVSIAGTGPTHSAKVLGYNVADDVALLQIDDVSNLDTIPIGDPSTVAVSDRIVAIGNALGRGGTPTAIEGSVAALDQTITASDGGGGNVETLHGLIQIYAGIQPGDSGGALVDADGNVVGMTTAASGGGFRETSGNVGFAIPIDDALAVAKRIQAGKGDDETHIGGSKALIGVSVRDAGDSGSRSGNPFGRRFGDDSGDTAPVSSGALVMGVQSDGPADGAGLSTGDVIVAVGDQTIGSASELTNAMVRYQPHDKVSVTWVDSSGSRHRASLQLDSGPPA